VVLPTEVAAPQPSEDGDQGVRAEVEKHLMAVLGGPGDVTIDVDVT
jgi:hypothetical protein